MLRGRVSNRSGNPIGGVRVTVLDHPELGRTATRTDGGFDMAVNGGGPLTLVFERAGFIPVQRLVEDVPWENYRSVDDVVMIAYEDSSAEIDLSSPTAVQVAQSDPVTDGDGTRASTLLFESGTDAELEMPDGSTQDLDGAIRVRSTEYTVGENGLDAMPGQLPPASGYTYAVELSVDQAVSQGAARVTFSKPVVNYVDNFLDFPAGTDVPVGSYDRERGEWVGEPDGRVIEIVGESGGQAQVDVDGDGLADGGAALTELGIDPAELERLASLYDAGKSLWRVQLSHFSPADYNWPFAPGAGARAPDVLGNLGKSKQDDGCPPKETQCETQTQGQQVALPGTEQTMNYESDRVPDNTDDFTLDIPASGDEVPPGLKSIEVKVEAGGQTVITTLPPVPDQTATLTLDGHDGYGRVFWGSIPAEVTVGYEYDAVYMEPAEFRTSWARFPRVPVSADGARQSITLYEQASTVVGSVDLPSIGLGGWTLSEHHMYDPTARVLYLGDGSRRVAEQQGLRVLERFAGRGTTNPGAVGDGGAARNAFLNEPHGLAVGPDGSVYVADTLDERVRRVAPNGTISTVAGTGVFGFSGDGGQATAARLASPEGLSFARDGSFYIADTKNNRIRRVTADGKIATVAGGGTPADGVGDGGPATQARLSAPTGVVVGPDGTIYIADRAAHRVRMVTPDGSITTVAGGAEPGFSGDGGPAQDALLRIPSDVAVTDDGTLYVADSGNSRIRRIRVSGVIDTVAGGGSPLDGIGDNGPAAQAALTLPTAISAAPDGSLYVADRGSGRVRNFEAGGAITTVAGGGGTEADDDVAAADASLFGPAGVAPAPNGALYVAERTFHRVHVVKPLFEGFAQDDILIASEDGTDVYRFNRFGRHLSTLDALTGAARWTYAYDGAGRLASATGLGGRTLTIERSPAGAPTAIVSPGGQRTELGVDPNGFLSLLENPDGEAVTLGYTDGGLLTGIEDPLSGDSAFTYDGRGRLTGESDPHGGERTLTRQELSNGHRVTLTSDEGNTWSYRLERFADGSTRRTAVDGAGGTTVTTREADGATTVEYSDGTSVRAEIGPDPRFGLEAPILTRRVETTPAGLERVTQQNRSVVLTDPADPLSVEQLSDTVNVNGRFWSLEFDGDTRTITRTSPEARTSTTVLDAQGRVVSATPAAGLNAIETTFDGEGRVARIEQGAQFWDYGYDSRDRVATRTNAAGDTVAYEYDGADRITKVILPSLHEYRYTYDDNGNRTAIVMPKGPTHELEYTAGQLARSYRPPGSTGAYTRSYDGDGKLTGTALPGGRDVDYLYDAGARPESITAPDLATTYTWTGATDRPAQISTAPLAGGAAQTVGYTYDGLLVTETGFGGPATGTFEYEYDDNLLLFSTTLTAGVDTVSLPVERDDDGLATLVGPFTVARDGPAGAASSYSDGTLAAELEYDGNGRLSERRSLVDGTEVYRAGLTRGLDGTITSRVEVVDGVTTTFDYTYDNDGQLLQVEKNGTVAEEYEYDLNGNRTSRTVGLDPEEAATYDAQDRLTGIGGTTYVLDADGMLESRGADTFEYGARGELLEATVGGTTVGYRYDGLGRRLTRSQGGQTTQYLYGNLDDPFQVTAVREPGGALTLLHYDELGMIHALERGGERYAVGSDQVGTPRVVTDSSGAVVRRIEYDAFGVVTFDSAPGFSLPIGFGGGIPDPLTGLVRFGLRDYDPRAGRFTSRDPSLFGGSPLNLFVYVGNDPVAFRDPTGLVCFEAKLFEGVGASFRACFDEKGWSFCAAPGVGYGAGYNVEPFGQRDKDGLTVNGELSGQVGGVKGGIGFSIPLDCGSPPVSVSGSYKLGPFSFKAGVNAKGQVKFGFSGGGKLDKLYEDVWKSGAGGGASMSITVRKCISRDY